MASTITLANSITWAQGYLFSQPLTLGAANEPAITIANIIKQAILGPPFCWRWNRGVLSTPISLSQGTQDYSKAVADFGFIEKAWLTLPTTNAVKEIEEIVDVLPAETIQGRPDRAIAAQLDDNAGNITFRLSPVPDQSGYAAQVTYQKKPTLFTATSGTWAPIPDEYSYIYQYGFLGMALAFNKDPRAGVYDSRFVAHLLGCQGGLSEMQKNIFLGKWLSTALEVGTMNQRAQLGVQGRSQ